MCGPFDLELVPAKSRAGKSVVLPSLGCGQRPRRVESVPESSFRFFCENRTMRFVIQLCLSMMCAMCLRFALAAISADVRMIWRQWPCRPYSGDGGTALDAGIGGPFGLAVGPEGAVYVCSVGNHCIRRIDESTGLISTFAGSGKLGYDGDGKPANRALCNEPYDVRFDPAGNLYFVEMQNHIVRRVDAATKHITTVAGNGQPGFTGDGGKAVKARLKQPHSIALDGAGNVYIADIGNHRIRRVDLQTGLIDTVAGTGEKAATPDGAPFSGVSLDGPRAIDFDSRGQMYPGLPRRRERRLPRRSAPAEVAARRRHRTARFFRRRRTCRQSRSQRAKGNRRRPRWRCVPGRYREPRDPCDPRFNRQDRNAGRRRHSRRRPRRPLPPLPAQSTPRHLRRRPGQHLHRRQLRTHKVRKLPIQ